MPPRKSRRLKKIPLGRARKVTFFRKFAQAAAFGAALVGVAFIWKPAQSGASRQTKQTTVLKRQAPTSRPSTRPTTLSKGRAR